MQLYRSVLIYIIVSIGSSTNFRNRFTVTASITEQTANSAVDKKQYHRYLRSSTSKAYPSASTLKLEGEKSIHEDMTSRRNDVTYEVDSGTESIYINGEKY